MNDIFFFFAISLAIAGFISLFLGIYIWKKEKTLKQFFFTFMMLLSSFWCFIYILELFSPSESFAIFFANLKFISVTLIPVAFLLFSLIYIELEEKKMLKKSLFLFIIPLINIGLIFSNNIHHLFWISRSATQTTLGFLISSVDGPLFWFHTVYSYVILFFGIFFIVKSLFYFHHLYSKQAMFLIAGVAAPIVGNIIIVFGLFPLPYDITPILFVVTGILFSLAIFQYRLFSIVPIAREKIVEHLSEAIFVVDTHQIIIDMNHSGNDLIKNRYISTYGKDEIIGSSATTVFNGVFDFRFFDTSSAHKNEAVLTGNQGEKFFEVEVSPIYGGKHDRKGHTIIMRDVTTEKVIEKKEKQRMIRIQHQQKAIAQLSKNKFLLTGEKQKAFALITETAAELLAVDRASIWLLQKNQTELYCIDLFVKSTNTHSSGGVLKAVEYPHYFDSLMQGRAIDADDAYTDSRTKEFRDDYLMPLDIVSMLDAPIWVSGKLVGVLCHEHVSHRRRWLDYEVSFAGELTDQISQVILNAERTKAINALRESEKKYRTVFENTGTSLGLFGDDSIISMVNSEFEKLTGYSKDEVEHSMHWYDIVTKEDRTRLLAYHKQRTKKTGNPPNEYDCTIVDKHGNLKTVHVCISVIPDTSVRIVSLNDITELRETHNKLRELNITLEKKVDERTVKIEQLLKQKDDFINQLSHDLKNPLGPLVNLIPLVEKRLSNAEDRQILQIVQRNVDYMKNLVEKTLKLARLNSPNTSLHFEQVNLGLLCKKVVDINQYLLSNNHVSVDICIPDYIVLRADSLRLEELFNNLLNNAVKYSPNGSIVVIGAEKHDDSVSIYVRDNGQGMTQDQIDQVFDEFYKADSSRHDFQSSGLGMPICKRIAEKHGGSIWVESDGIGKGCTFYVSLPLKQASQEVKNQYSSQDVDISSKVDRILLKD